jgi:hypothetical protein
VEFTVALGDEVAGEFGNTLLSSMAEVALSFALVASGVPPHPPPGAAR